MKHSRFFRIMAAAVILALLMMVIPATPALAVATTSLSPTSGPTGTLLTIYGDGFAPNNNGYVWFDSDDDGVRDTGEPFDTFMTTGTGDIPVGTILTVPEIARGSYDVLVDVPIGSSTEGLAAFAVTPEITTNVSSGHVGDTITVDGTGFLASATVTIYYDTTSVGVDSTNSYGTFDNFTFTVPASVKGTHTIRGKDTTVYSPTVNFIVSPKITISPTSGAVGDTVTISGTGFATSSSITISFDAVSQTTTSTNSSGTFSATTFTVPSTLRGSHTVKARDASANYATATFTVSAKITIDPTSGPSGTPVTITGTGFGASRTITIKYNNVTVTTNPATVTTNPVGYFTATFTVPVGTAGTYEVEASDGTNTATADFESTTDATISQTTSAADPGNVGMSITITGVGFTPSATVTVTYATDPVVLATVTTGSTGNFTATFTIPPSVGGPHVITVSDGTITKVFDFFMEESPPPIAALQLPLVGEKADSETVFDWDPVDDVSPASNPVTYDLQVATSQSFSSTSLLINETGLTQSTYTISAEDKLESTSQDEPYYWQVRAVDAASNASGWNETGSFYVGFSLEITGWLMYVIMAAIAVAFFFLGLWLGRRSGVASYY